MVKQVLEDSKLKINTNPVEVYKSWVNQMESETGQVWNSYIFETFITIYSATFLQRKADS